MLDGKQIEVELTQLLTEESRIKQIEEPQSLTILTEWRN